MSKKKDMKKRQGTGSLYALFCLLFLSFATNVSAAEDVFLVLSSDAEPYRQAADALQSALRKENIETQTALSKNISAAGLEYSFNADTTKVWVAIGSRAAMQLNTLLPQSTPLVYCMVADPDKIGLENAREHIVGVSVTKPVQEQFAIMQKAIPDLRSIGMLYRSSSMKSMQTLIDVNAHLPSDWTLEAVDIDKADSMADAIAKLFRRDVGMIWTMADSAIYNRATVNSLLLASLRQQVPVFGFSGSFVKAGALLGLEADPFLQGEYAASLVLEEMNGKAKTVPLSSGVTLVVNMVVADRLGISLPEEIVAQALVIGIN